MTIERLISAIEHCIEEAKDDFKKDIGSIRGRCVRAVSSFNLNDFFNDIFNTLKDFGSCCLRYQRPYFSQN